MIINDIAIAIILCNPGEHYTFYEQAECVKFMVKLICIA